MSFFYLSPIKGDMPLYLLETIITKRIEYLKSILRQEEAFYSEYMVEGGIFDNVGYFMLCILSILNNKDEFTRFILHSEKELFKLRLRSLSAYDLRCFSKKLLRAIRKLNTTPTYIKPLQVLCQHLMLRELAHHVGQTHDDNCCMYSIPMKFQYCLQLIAARQVEITNGIARIACCKWKYFLIQLFHTQLKYRLQNTNLTNLRNDMRVMDLLGRLKEQLFNLTYHPRLELKSTEVDQASTYFPPCMLNLHKNLRQKHRMSHIHRFNYSLFLKDIGMPIEEAISFWKTEYKKPSEAHSCCHNWDNDEKKFVYGIRHLYGLEGSRKTYTSVNCQKVQSSECSISEGGCPFKTFDSNTLLKLLNVNNNEILCLQINELRIQKKYISACQMYMQNKYRNNVLYTDYSFNFSPIKFFRNAINSN
ncbi:DNA primase large subunit-like [Battus philenor]|uniref:DNA primase large subunit-like n=1 Tax=Battus philenor TaxID=42288 RepID=UPI0035CF02AD